MEKKGQVTLFVIIAILIVIAGALIFSLTGGLESSSTDIENNPRLFIRDCIEDTLIDNIELLSTQGGSISPEFYYEYYGDKIEYLCSTNQNYEVCTTQRPFLKNHIEEELKKSLKSKVSECLDEMEKVFKEKGNTVVLERGDYNIEILPKRITLTMENELTISRTETNRYTDFTTSVNSNLYDLIGLARTIVEWESLAGDVNPTEFMSVYHDIKIEKKRGQDGVKVYILSDRNTKDKFQLASRSMVFPAGLI